MAKKYNFSVTYPVGDGITETLQVVEGDSFDEVIRIVERGVKERMEAIHARVNKPAAQEVKKDPVEPPKTALPDVVKTFSDREMDNEIPNNIPTTQHPGAPTPSNHQPA